MSVVVKGMRMPENCDYCRFCLEEDEMFETVYRCDITGEYINGDYDGVYPDNCPLVDLGKHGRLIDADKLVGDLAKAIPYFIDDAVTTAYVEGLQRAKIEIDDAPTVIEAEE